jgi:hypothetical protein
MEYQREGWQYARSAQFFQEISRLNKDRIEKKACSLMAKETTPPGQNIKSTQRKIQRWRKSGLSLREVADRLGYISNSMEDELCELD